MTQLRPDLPPLPPRIKKLPIDERGYPVPRFVEWITPKGVRVPPGTEGSTPDFRIMNSAFLVIAVRCNLCWICGEPLGRNISFVIGPMCTVNRISAEPPSHRSCAQFAVKACPFLSKPDMKRREVKHIEIDEAAGVMIKRNPGVTVIWTCRDYKLMQVDNGVLFQIGETMLVEWFHEGRPATRAEVADAFEAGLPTLEEAARVDGDAALAELERLKEKAMVLWP